MKRVLLAVLALALITTAVPAKTGTMWQIDLTGGRLRSFFNLPWPSELRRQADGFLDLKGFPNPYDWELVDFAAQGVSRGYGFGLAETIYFRFSGPLAADKLPQGAAALAAGSPLFIIDVDPQSPERGKRFPLIAKFYAESPRLIRNADNLLAFAPLTGFMFRPNTLYAAGVTTAVPAVDGAPPPAGILVDIAAGKTPPFALGVRAADLYREPLAYLAAQGLAPDKLAALTVFRTGDPTARMLRVYDAVQALPTVKLAAPLSHTREYPLFHVLSGTLLLPQFQPGRPPFGHARGGVMQMGADGLPTVQRTDRVPVAFSIPKGKMPADGFPILVFIHGTSGGSTQFIDRGVVPNDKPHSTWNEQKWTPQGQGPAMVLAHHGIAGVGAAQPMSDDRGFHDKQFFFYNFPHIETLRDNVLQAAGEASMIVKLMKAIEIDPALCPGVETGGKPIRFNPKLMFGMGQSLGSLILGPVGAVDEDLKALIPAGNGGSWVVFMSEGNPADLERYKEKKIGMFESWGLDRFHPVMMLLGTVMEAADPMIFQPHFFREPFPGRAPKNVFVAFGLYDHYFNPRSQNAATVAMGVDQVGPIMDDRVREMLRLAGRKELNFPVTGNIVTPAGTVTAVAMQMREVPPLDGHHVFYQRDDAKFLYGCFLESYIKNGVPTLYPPKDKWDAPCE